MVRTVVEGSSWHDMMERGSYCHGMILDSVFAKWKVLGTLVR